MLYLSFSKWEGVVLGAQVDCERVEYEEGLKTCFSTFGTTVGRFVSGISSASQRDENMKKLRITGNSKAQYFPENISEIFPFLEFFEAVNFPLKAVPEDTYRNLKNLKEIRLHGNLFEKIERKLFHDSTELEILNMGKNN